MADHDQPVVYSASFSTVTDAEKALDRTRIRVIPELFGGGALPRQELRQAAEELTGDQAGLLVVTDEPAIEKALDKAVAGAVRVGKRRMHASIDQLTSELKEALAPHAHPPRA
jgi:hypothetical protein